MSVNRWRFVLAAVLLVPAHAFAGDEKDQQAYCAYVIEQAQAQRDLLRTPTGVVGTTQPETGLPLQVVGGATLGLADLRKAVHQRAAETVPLLVRPRDAAAPTGYRRLGPLSLPKAAGGSRS